MSNASTAPTNTSEQEIKAILRRSRATNLDQTCLAMGFADLHKTDSQAETAARQAARRMGEPKPQTVLEHLAANFLGVRGHFWVETKLGEQRFRIACWQQALEGSKAYLQGQQGNEYSQFLTKRFGPCSTYQVPFHLDHWWFAKEWHNNWLWFFALLGGLIAALPFLDNDLRPAIEKLGLSGLWDRSEVGQWSRTSFFFGLPLAILIIHSTLDSLFGEALFKQEREKAHEKHKNDWAKVHGFRMEASSRALDAIGDKNQFVTWYGGHNERFGPKEFWVECNTDISPLDLLCLIASAVSQSHLTQSWRVTPQIRYGAKAKDSTAALRPFDLFCNFIYTSEQERVGFVATGSYSWDDQSFLARTAEGVAIMGDVSQMRGGKSDIHLECVAITTNETDRCYLRLRFSERTYPMWIRRQAEGLVALTVQEIRERLEMECISNTWKFLNGDWATYQLLRLPNQTGVELQPSCSLDVLQPPIVY